MRPSPPDVQKLHTSIVMGQVKLSEATANGCLGIKLERVGGSLEWPDVNEAKRISGNCVQEIVLRVRNTET